MSRFINKQTIVSILTTSLTAIALLTIALYMVDVNVEIPLPGESHLVMKSYDDFFGGRMIKLAIARPMLWGFVERHDGFSAELMMYIALAHLSVACLTIYRGYLLAAVALLKNLVGKLSVLNAKREVILSWLKLAYAEVKNFTIGTALFVWTHVKSWYEILKGLATPPAKAEADKTEEAPEAAETA